MEYKNHKLRHELKYLINYGDYQVLRERLALAMKHDSHSNPDYLVRSLYFDNIRNSAYHDKTSGILERKKFRIRTYNSSSEVIKLELKRKFGEYISKTSQSITMDEYRKILDRDLNFAITHENPLLRSFYLESRNSLLKPKIIVDYTREAFICDEGNVRITFDRELCCGFGNPDLFDKSIITARADIPNTLIMEIKYDDFIPKKIKKLITPHCETRQALSKYVMCRDTAKLYSGGLK